MAECRVDAEGALVDCTPLAADPPGMGFSEAAAKIAAALRVSAWTDAGGPTQGARVQVPIHFGADNPDDAQSLHERGLAEREKGSLDEALADFANELGARSEERQGLLRSRRRLRLAGPLRPLPSRTTHQAIALDPNDPKSYNKRGVEYDNKGLQDLAIADFSKSMALKPGVAGVVYDRGVTYERKRASTIRPSPTSYLSDSGSTPTDADSYVARGGSLRQERPL